MDDTNRLVMVVDSSGVARSTSILDTFADSADRVESAVRDLTGAIGRLGQTSSLVDANVRKVASGVKSLDDSAAQNRLGRYFDDLERRAASLTRTFDPLTAAQNRHNATMIEAGRLLRLGSIEQTTYAATVDRSRAMIQEAGIRASRAAAVDQSSVNSLLGVSSRPGGEARASAGVFSDNFRAQDAIAREQRKADADAARAQARAAVETSRETKKAEAQAMREVRREAEALDVAGANMAVIFSSMERESEKLRATLNPLADAQRKLNAETARFAELRRSGFIQPDEEAAFVAMSTRNYDKRAEEIARTNRPGGLRADLMTNLSFQANDIVTMASMGMAPQQILASQGGQIFQILQQADGGPLAAIKMLGEGLGSFLRTFVTPATLGVTALGGAILYMAMKSTEAEKSVEASKKAVEEYNRALQNTKSIYGDLAQGAAAVFDREMALDPVNLAARTDTARREQEKARAAAVAATQESMSNSLVGSDYAFFDPRRLADNVGNLTRTLSPEYMSQVREVNDLVNDLAAGRVQVTEFQRELSRIQLDPKTRDDVREMTEELISSSDAAREAEARLKALTRAAEELRRASAMKDFKAASESLTNLVPDRMTPRQEVERTFNTTMGSIRQLRESPRFVEGQIAKAEAQRLAALKDIADQELVNQRIMELAVQGVGARTVAERALIAAEQTRLELVRETMEEDEKRARVAHAAQMVIAEAVASSADALRSSQQSAAGAGLQGYAASVAQINARYEEQIRLAQGSAEAVYNLSVARGIDLQVLEQSTRDELYRPQETRLRQLQLEAEMIGRTAGERSSANARLSAELDLTSRGIDLNSQWARSAIDNEVALDAFSRAIDRQAKSLEALEDVGSSALDGLFDAAIKGGDDFLANIGRVAGQAGQELLKLSLLNPLQNSLFDKGLPTIDGIFGKLTGAVPALAPMALGSSPVTPMWVKSADVLSDLTGAPLGEVTRSQLPPLEDLATKGSRVGGDAIANSRVAGAFEASVGGRPPSVASLTDYITKAATARGIDPSIAVKVARSEGLAEGVWQAGYVKNGFREPSYGPFQLLKGGKGTGFPEGMGNDFMARTGLDPADPKNVYQGIDFALDGAAKNGWGAWYGAAKVGVGKRDGLSGARAIGVGNERGGGAAEALESATNDVRQSAPKISEAALTMSARANDLATNLTSLSTGFGFQSTVMLDGMQGTIQDFLPKFGGNLNSLLDAVAGGGKGAGGGLFDALVGSRSAATGISLGTTRAILGGAAGLFAKGGVANNPSVFAESGPEAAVPLPDGRTIPVTLSGTLGDSAGGDRTVVFSPVISVTGGGGTREQNTQLTEEMVNQLRGLVRTEVGSEFLQQSRNGGMMGRF